MSDQQTHARQRERQGFGLAIAAYTLWGLAPIYWKAVSAIDATELIAHRVIWAFPTLILIVALQRGLGQLKEVLRSPKSVATLLFTTTLIVTNWFIFVYAIATNRILDTSLGYFINPLVFTLLGFVFLKERLPKRQLVAVAIAALGVGYMAYDQGSLPWISLALAFSFATYGVVRKTIPVSGIHGLTLEVAFCLPFAIGFLVWLGPESALGVADPFTLQNLLIVCAGPVTAVPLLLFTSAVRRIKLTTIGFLQYLAPTMTFALGVFVYDESFTHSRLVAFAMIWLALALYSLDAITDKGERRA